MVVWCGVCVCVGGGGGDWWGVWVGWVVLGCGVWDGWWWSGCVRGVLLVMCLSGHCCDLIMHHISTLRLTQSIHITTIPCFWHAGPGATRCCVTGLPRRGEGRG